MKIFVKLKPGAKADRVIGWLGEMVKIEVKAPPIDGKANLALIDFLAGKTGVLANMIVIKAGWTNRQKLIEIKSELTNEEIIARIKK